MSRQREIAWMENRMADVRGGLSRSLVIVGPAGIGKSWLCRQASELAEGFTVVATRGVEVETHLGYAGLFDVLTPLLDGRLERLLPARREALRGALRIAAAPSVDPFAVAVASLDLLAMAAEDAPLLVVVDDAPWVDAASLQALRFAARRLDADRVGFLFVARSESAAPFVDGETDSLTVSGLDADEAVELVREFAGSRVEASVARALAVAGEGHPLWLREAARALSPAQMTGAEPLNGRFSVPAAFAQAALGHALAVLAADEKAPPAIMERALSDLGAGPGALDVGLGLIHLEAGRPRFSHPLALELEVGEPEQRRLAHEALARAWEPERATWHLAAAGAGPDADRGYPLLKRNAGRVDDSCRTPGVIHASAQLGMNACWMEDYATARRELEGAVAVARERGLVSSLPLALSALSELEFRLGNWLAARAHADEALRLGEEVDEFRHYGHLLLLLLDAVTGDADGAHRYADIVLAIAERSGSRSLAMHAYAALGLLELGLDHPEAAIVHLTRTREITSRGAVDEPNVVRFMPDLVESQIRAGLEHDARATLAVFEAQAQRTGRRWALAAAARCRGLLAPPEAADAVFAEALRLVAAEPSPFEIARTELCWGERLRRDGRRVEARRHLHEAHQRFHALGAVPWAEKAVRELRSSGGRARRGPQARSDELTAQQLQIATMVAEGRTNKSVATSLFLSPRTIEFHLGHVYRKLHVSNRTELARALFVASASRSGVLPVPARPR